MRAHTHTCGGMSGEFSVYIMCICEWRPEVDVEYLPHLLFAFLWGESVCH